MRHPAVLSTLRNLVLSTSGPSVVVTPPPPLCSTSVNTFMSCLRPLVLQALIGLFELPEDDSIPDDEHFIDIEDTPGYQTAFSQLAFAGKKEHDPIGDAVSNPKILLAQSLHKLSTACPGRVSPQYTSQLVSDFIITGDVAVSISCALMLSKPDVNN